MKKTIIGGIGVLSSVILFGMVLISASIYSRYLVEPGFGGWDPNLGVFGTALKVVGTLPLIICVLLFLAGVGFFVWDAMEES